MTREQDKYWKIPAKKFPKPKASRPAVPPESKDTPTLAVDLMLEALRVDDDRLNAIAIELMGRLEGEPLRRLAMEAANPENSPGHRLRLLKAIRHIGAVPDANSFFDVMFTSMRDKNAAVRTAAREVIASLPGRHSEATADR
jgi:hypothetical protein